MSDRFSDQYADLLEGHYDCVDRIVLNAYFPLGQKAGGFRTWWRLLNGGDETLDDTHLMRLAGRFSRRVRAFAKGRGIPVVFCAAGTRKHELAREYLAQHPQVRGVFMILIARAPQHRSGRLSGARPARSRTSHAPSLCLMSTIFTSIFWTRSGGM